MREIQLEGQKKLLVHCDASSHTHSQTVIIIALGAQYEYARQLL